MMSGGDGLTGKNWMLLWAVMREEILEGVSTRLGMLCRLCRFSVETCDIRKEDNDVWHIVSPFIDECGR